MMNSHNEDDRLTTQHDFDYKPKLLGILPQSFVYKKPTRFETQDLLLCKTPAQQSWLNGPVISGNHPSLAGQAIIEKKCQSSDYQQYHHRQRHHHDESHESDYEDDPEQQAKFAHLESQLSNLLFDPNEGLTATSTLGNNCNNGYQHQNSNNCHLHHQNLRDKSNTLSGSQDDAYFTHWSSEQSINSTNAGGDAGYDGVVIPNNRDDDEDDGSSVDSEELKNIWNSGSFTMRFLKNNFQPGSDTLPDFTCNRSVLVNLMTEPNDFVIQAIKQKFVSRVDNSGKEFSTIELHFRPINFDDVSSKSTRIVSAIQSKVQMPVYDIVNGRLIEKPVHEPVPLLSVETSPMPIEPDSDKNWRSASNYTADFPRLGNGNQQSSNYTNQPDSYGSSTANANNSPRSRSDDNLYSSTPILLRDAQYKPWNPVSPTSDGDFNNDGSRSNINRHLETLSCTGDGDSEIESEFSETPYYAFVQGKLTKVDKLRQELSKSFTFNMGMYVDGVWTNKSNAYNYTCKDLAEVKTAKSTTLKAYGVGRDFYKQVRMAQNWSQTYLAGLKQYMVGVTAPSKVDPNERAIEELLLYCVDKVPSAVKYAAEQYDFKAWDPNELQSKLFSYLQEISEQMSSKAYGVPVNFFHYSGSSFLSVMTNGEVHDEIKCLQEYRKKIILKGLQQPPPMATEDRRNAFNDAQIKTLLKFIKWPVGQFGRPVVKRVNREIQLTFESELLANVFSRLVKNIWRFKNTVKVPPGFESLWVEKKAPMTKRHENALLSKEASKRGAGSDHHHHHIGATGDSANILNNNSSPNTDNRFSNQQKPRKFLQNGLYPSSMWSQWNSNN